MSESHVLDEKRVAQLCIDTFDGLPKTGKPIDNKEWTVLSCILLFDNRTNDLQVVSLGTGTKCIGHQAMSTNGVILNDSHAEVMCRRGFLRYLYSELNSTKESKSIFTLNRETKKFELNTDLSFHFFTTHGPCGDASIFHNDSDETTTFEEEVPSKKQKLSDSPCANIENFTGAKIITSDFDVPQDLMVQSIGAVRTKPGRGVHTLSMSCSDKMARWNVLGVQGALLNMLINKPIYLESITINKTPYCDIEATERAIWKRFDSTSVHFSSTDMIVMQPKVRECSGVKFKYEKQDHLEPSPCSIVWCKVSDRPFEVGVAGKRQGVTKKRINTPNGRLLITKKELFKKFVQTIDHMENDLQSYSDVKLTPDTTYDEVKMLSNQYQSTWNELKKKYFRIWTNKRRELNQFQADD